MSVTVTAQPNGMTVTIGRHRVLRQASQDGVRPGVDEASACVFTFPLASVRYDRAPPDSTTALRAAWTSNTGPGGDLKPKTMSAVTNIPVIQVQSRVSEVN